jgi:hypothetical protein
MLHLYIYAIQGWNTIIELGAQHSTPFLITMHCIVQNVIAVKTMSASSLLDTCRMLSHSKQPACTSAASGSSSSSNNSNFRSTELGAVPMAVRLGLIWQQSSS